MKKVNVYNKRIQVLATIPLSEDDRYRQDYLTAWMRLASVLGAEIAIYLDKVVSFVFKSAVPVLGGQMDGEEDEENETGEQTDLGEAYRARTAAVCFSSSSSSSSILQNVRIDGGKTNTISVCCRWTTNFWRLNSWIRLRKI